MATSVLFQNIKQWLDTMTPDQFEAQVKADVRLTSLLEPHKAQIRLAKHFVKLDLDEKTLLQNLLAERPLYGSVCVRNRDWYSRNVRELESYIASL